MRAADALMECLKAEGVESVFGLPGGANLPTYDALYDAGIRHVLVRHEAGGGPAPQGHAKAPRRVGGCLPPPRPPAPHNLTPPPPPLKGPPPGRVFPRPGPPPPPRT